MSHLFRKTRRCYLIDHHSPQPPAVPLGKLQIEEYKDFFRQAEIDSLMVYCKDHWGVTYYDSQVEGAQKHLGLKGDWIREVRTAAAEMDIEFVAYYCIEYDEGAARRFPDWRVRKADGQPLIRDDRYAKWSLVCCQTGYRDYALAQLEEIVASYHPDSLFLDIFGSSLCYCPSCRSRFQSLYGYALPESESDILRCQKDIKDFLNHNAEEFYREMSSRVKAIDPDLAITVNFSCHYPAGLRSLLDYQFSEPLMKDNWYSAAYARDTAAGQSPILAPGEASQVYNYDSADQYICDLSSIAAQGCRVGMYSGSQHIDGTLDHEEAKRLGAAYRELKKLEPWLSRDRSPVRSVGILQSDLSKLVPDREFHPDAILRMKNRSPHTTAILGAMTCCETAKLPYTILPEESLSQDLLSAYDCILLPEVYVLSDRVQQLLEAYTAGGGKLIVSGKTGWHNEGQGYSLPHTLHQLMGICPIRLHEEYAQNDWSAYLQAAEPSLFQGLLSVTTPPVSDYFIEAKTVTARPLARFLKPALACSSTEWINWWSPPAGEKTNFPAISQNTFGRGQSIYLAYDFFTMAASEKYRDSHSLFQDLLRLLSVHPIFRNETDTPEILRTAYFETEEEIHIHQISTLPSRYHGESLPISGGIIRSRQPLLRARRVYPDQTELPIKKEGDDYVIPLPEFRLQQFIVVEK